MCIPNLPRVAIPIYHNNLKNVLNHYIFMKFAIVKVNSKIAIPFLAENYSTNCLYEFFFGEISSPKYHSIHKFAF